ncbi:hypothetical protein Tsubulata_040242 [Turnera subulata]|uniref:Protein LURP-one-related 7 n=1 Tax=Turnera subulata TaxID=218843 RepID=A0A9Q0J4E4_9ROSI|nr:hypothetical protein Tsubulata_040242 [Turnera subulata]
MDTQEAAPVYPSSSSMASSIPIDLFVSKKHPGLARGELGFADSSGNIVFKANRCKKQSSSSCKKLLLDAHGNVLVSMHRQDGGHWEGFKEGGNERKDLIFTVQRTSKKLTRSELQVSLAQEISGDLAAASGLNVIGCPCQRSCTVYKGDSIVAQTSLMYKLHQIYARKNKFRLTIFPVSIDHALIASLVVIFLD